MHLLEFVVDNQRRAVPVEVAERVYPASEVTPLTDAPGSVLGLMSIHGKVLPVFSLRKRLGLPDREIRPADRMVVLHIGRRTVVLLVDAVPGVLDVDDPEFVSWRSLFPEREAAGGVAHRVDGLVLVEDLESIFGAEVEACPGEDRENGGHGDVLVT